MAFQLSSVVPWGRNLVEYRSMFQLTDEDLAKKIAGFGDGPASFNCEATRQGYSVISLDPIYQFSTEALRRRIGEARVTVMKQMEENRDRYVWTHIKSLEELEHTRLSAMELFLTDYEKGKREKRYICHALPDRTPFADDAFDIGLSSHFLLLYPGLGYDFHIQSITEMLRVCKEVRIFPVVDLDARETDLAAEVIAYLKRQYIVELRNTDYEFQKGGSKMLIIKKAGCLCS